ncbi:protein FAM228A isoform X2 [Mugil cephalus]|uniref:protein FAM228A isoform X2 n=1 Tax=Mugil cephalus TaxID=48193 RepID=UPI001FB653AF|nr:protein FAM228A isoform X2 [Mugil cephalus]
MADMKDSTGSREGLSQPSARTRSGCVRPWKRKEASSSAAEQAPKENCLPHTSLRQLQAEMEAEKQQVKEIIQPFLNTENGFMKLECFFNQREVTELRRKELLHKRWTEHVWFPLQYRVEERVSRCSPSEAKRRQSLYSHYLQHCNTKGCVFLDTYDLREYNPFLLNIKKTHNSKHKTPDSKDQFHLEETLKEKKTPWSTEAGKCSQRKVEKVPRSSRPLSESVTSQVIKLLQASSNRPVSASIKIPLKDESELTMSSRLNTVKHHISVSATTDGRCHQSSCWFSRCGCRQQAASLQQLSLPTSK